MPRVFNTAFPSLADLDAELTELRSGVSRSSLVDAGFATKLWSFRVPGGEPIYSSAIGPIAVKEGSTPRTAVVFTCWDGFVYAVDVTNGSQIWRRAAGVENYGRCQAGAVLGGVEQVIFAPSHDGRIYAISDNGATEHWQFASLYEREGSGTTSATTATTVTDGAKTWAANAFLRFDGATFGASLRFTSGPASGQSREIVGNPGGSTLTVASAFDPVPTGGGGDTYVIDPRYSSDIYWQHAGTLNREGANWFLYATGFDNHCYKINAASGALVWKFATLENIEPYPLVVMVGSQRRVFFGSIDRKVRALNAETGAFIWEQTVGQIDSFLQAADTDNDGNLELLVGSRNGRVYRLSAESGAILDVSTDTASWQFPEINCHCAPLQLSGESRPRIFTGGDSGSAWCFDDRLNTKWEAMLAPQVINSSPLFHDVDNDGDPEVLIGDMRGTLHVLNARTGRRVGVLYVKGGIEGVPLYGDLDGDGQVEIVITTTDGYVDCYRFSLGAVLPYPYSPGAALWRGFQEV